MNLKFCCRSLSSAKSRDLEKSGLKTPDAIAKYKLCSASEGSGALSISRYI